MIGICYIQRFSCLRLIIFLLSDVLDDIERLMLGVKQGSMRSRPRLDLHHSLHTLGLTHKLLLAIDALHPLANDLLGLFSFV